ncbi:MAG: SRPBCC family protein [Ktedonobacterales bacterium]
MLASDNPASPPEERELVITHVFDAPRALVWQAFTESDGLAHWWGPAGSALFVHTLEMRPGGIFLYSMRTPDGHVIWGRFVYRDIQPPERIVFISSFSDEAGAVTRAPFSATWPLEILNAVTLVEYAGKTTVTLRGGPLNPTDEERDTFWSAEDSVRQGFAGTFGQLADYLVGQVG